MVSHRVGNSGNTPHLIGKVYKDG